MIIISSQFDKLDGYIAEAALGNISWSQSLELMAPLAGADSISLDLIFGNNQSVTSLGAMGFDQALVQAYGSHYHRIDPRMATVRNHKDKDQGFIFDDDDLRASPQEHDGEFWHWLKQANAPFDGSVLVMPCVGDSRIMLGLHRQPGNSASPVKFLQKFYDKLNAINAAIRRDQRDQRHNAPAGLPLKNVGSFEFCVDEAMAVADVDSLTRYRLALTGLAGLDEENRLVEPALDFNLAVASVLESPASDREAQITHNTPVVDTIVNITAVQGANRSRLAKVHVTYLNHKTEPAKIFMSSFGLTRRQAELLQALRRVYSLDEAARSMSISRNTARVFLGQIYDRTGVRRKSKLLSLADKFA